MPLQQPTFQPTLNVDIANATETKITNLPMPIANTEYLHDLVDGLKQLRIRCRGIADMQYSFVIGESSTKYFSIYKGTCDNLIDLDFTSKTLYIQSNKNSMIAEIMELY